MVLHEAAVHVLGYFLNYITDPSPIALPLLLVGVATCSIEHFWTFALNIGNWVLIFIVSIAELEGYIGFWGSDQAIY
jgi:hypothetical protein